MNHTDEVLKTNKRSGRIKQMKLDTKKGTETKEKMNRFDSEVYNLIRKFAKKTPQEVVDDCFGQLNEEIAVRRHPLTPELALIHHVCFLYITFVCPSTTETQSALENFLFQSRNLRTHKTGAIGNAQHYDIIDAQWEFPKLLESRLN